MLGLLLLSCCRGEWQLGKGLVSRHAHFSEARSAGWGCLGEVWGCGQMGMWDTRGVLQFSSRHQPAAWAGGGGVRRGVMVSWCHGVIILCQVPSPQERLLAVPARPEQHNTAASAMPRRAAQTPPPPLVRSLSKAAWPGQSRRGPMAPMMRQFLSCAQAHTQCLQLCQKQYILHGHTPNAFSSAKSNTFRMGTHPMPSVLPKAIHSAWAHTQCLQFCQK